MARVISAVRTPVARRLDGQGVADADARGGRGISRGDESARRRAEAAVTDIRPEVVAGLLQHNPFAIENATWREGREAGRVAALRNIAFGQELLASLGFTVDQPLPEELVPQVTRAAHKPIADASFVEAVSMWRQTVAYDAAMRLLLAWWPHQAEDRTLGELLQLVPSEVAAEVLGHLRCAGLQDLPDPGS
jgi:hypothetical protein